MGGPVPPPPPPPPPPSIAARASISGGISGSSRQRSTASFNVADAAWGTLCRAISTLPCGSLPGPPPVHSGSDGTVQLLEGTGVAERAERIMTAEPFIKQTGGVALLRDSPFTNACAAAHGTNLAAALSALRNTDGQLVPINQLGPLWATGATPEQILSGDGGANVLREVVFAADILRFGCCAIETAERYARGEAGMELKLEGSRSIRRSEASLIPALLIGELDDPSGKGAALNQVFQNPSAESVRCIPQGNPLHGKTVEEVQAVFADQIIGERFLIHGMFVAHPTDPAQDECVLELVEDLVRRATAEQRCQYGDIRVGLLRNEVAAFKQMHAGKQAVTRGDIQALLQSSRRCGTSS